MHVGQEWARKAQKSGGTVSQLGSETSPPVSAELGFQAHQKRWGMGLWRPSLASAWLFRYFAMSAIMAMSFDCSSQTSNVRASIKKMCCAVQQIVFVL